MSVRVALVGCGVMGSDHASILAEDVSGAVLQVVCDADRELAGRVADSCGARDASADAEGVISRRDVDAVMIASPDETHVPLILAALAVGKPVLCEKPLSQDSAEGLRVLDAEVKLGRRLVHIGYMRRFDPPYTRMKEALEDGSLGPAVMMHNFHRNVQAPPSFTGQMAITNSAPHEFDVVRFVLGTEFSTVSAFQAGSGASDLMGGPVVMVLETGAGQLVTIEVNVNAVFGYEVRAELVGETGSMVMNVPTPVRLNRDLASLESIPADWRPRFHEAYRLQNKDWIRSIVSGSPSGIGASAWDGYCASAVAEASVQALTEGRKVRIQLAERPELYRRRDEVH